VASRSISEHVGGHRGHAQVLAADGADKPFSCGKLGLSLDLNGDVCLYAKFLFNHRRAGSFTCGGGLALNGRRFNSRSPQAVAAVALTARLVNKRGHFTAWEEPELFAAELIHAFNSPR
jgi:hypothetical protein